MAKSNPYLKSANTEETYTYNEIQELKRCYEDPIYFIKNYVKIVHPTQGTVAFDLFDYQEDMIRAFHEEQYTVVLSARQTGKALDIRTPIPTPEGWTTMKDINIGDIIFDANDNPTKVIYTTDIMHNHICYNIVFSNGDNIIADAGHLWRVDGNITKPARILSTEEIINNNENSKYYINGLSIMSITKVDSVPVKCITVDNDDHLFLAGKSRIPTHNCTTYDTDINIVDTSTIPWYKRVLLRFINKKEYARLYN